MNLSRNFPKNLQQFPNTFEIFLKISTGITPFILLDVYPGIDLRLFLDIPLKISSGSNWGVFSGFCSPMIFRNTPSGFLHADNPGTPLKVLEICWSSNRVFFFSTDFFWDTFRDSSNCLFSDFCIFLKEMPPNLLQRFIPRINLKFLKGFPHELQQKLHLCKSFAWIYQRTYIHTFVCSTDIYDKI